MTGRLGRARPRPQGAARSAGDGRARRVMAWSSLSGTVVHEPGVTGGQGNGELPPAQVEVPGERLELAGRGPRLVTRCRGTTHLELQHGAHDATRRASHR